MNATGGVDRIVMIPAVKYTVEPQEMNATGGVDKDYYDEDNRMREHRAELAGRVKLQISGGDRG